MLTKSQIIELISEINRSARRDWLATFDLDELRLYLQNLQRTQEPRGRESGWIRPGDTPAVVTRRPAA